MPFKSRAALGGQIDPNINAHGRLDRKIIKATPREIRNAELLALLRKFKPNVAEAVKTAVEIMKMKEATETSRLKACTIVLDNYKELVGDLYDGTDEEIVEEIQEANRPVFSLKVVGQEEPVDKGE